MPDDLINFMKDTSKNGFYPQYKRELSKLMRRVDLRFELISKKLDAQMFNNASLELLSLAQDFTRDINELIAVIIEARDSK